METQTAVLKNLPLSKPPQQTVDNTSFHDSPQKDVNQLNQNIIFKRQANQEYKYQSQHHVVNIPYQKVTDITKTDYCEKEKDLIRMLKNKNLSSFFVLMQLHTCRKIVASNYRLEKKNRKNKDSGFAVMPEHVQKLLKLHRIEIHGNIIIIEKATST